MSKVEAVIFDWAGTTGDYGCFAPVQAFKDAFENYGLHPTFDEIRQPMGMLKIEHIKTMLNMKTLSEEFKNIYQRDYAMEDVHKIYAFFEDALMQGITKHTGVKPFVVETVSELRNMGIKIGSTTGYTDMMMEPVLKSAKEQGYEPDCWYSPDSTNSIGRPYPYMIYKNMETLKLKDVRTIIKVGDTISDIEEGIHAGVYTVGVIEGSSMMGYSEEEYNALDALKKDELVKKTRQAYLDAGAHDTIMNLGELIPLIRNLETK
ncbi:MAG: phosphonoacetaldehyde hydrolase [Coprobacillus sp.]